MRERNGVTEVQVYNPWGHTAEGGDGDGSIHGAFWMSQDDFNASFRQVEMMIPRCPRPPDQG